MHLTQTPQGTFVSSIFCEVFFDRPDHGAIPDEPKKKNDSGFKRWVGKGGFLIGEWGKKTNPLVKILEKNREWTRKPKNFKHINPRFTATTSSGVRSNLGSTQEASDNRFPFTSDHPQHLCQSRQFLGLLSSHHFEIEGFKTEFSIHRNASILHQ
jgi:hypothetical protein